METPLIYQLRPEITLPEGPPFDVVRMTGTESVSGLFQFDVDIAPLNVTEFDYSNLRSDELVGQLAQLTLQSANRAERQISGVISRFSIVPSEEYGQPFAYRVRLVSWFELLKYKSQCRIFEDQTLTDTIDNVFREVMLPGQEFKIEFHGENPSIDTCVQFQETDLNFVTRILERLGAFYFFEQSAEKQALVIADKNSAFRNLAGEPRASYGQSVTHWSMDHTLHCGEVAVRDYDYRNGQDIDASESTLVRIGPNDELKQLEYPGGFSDVSVARARARIGIQREETGHRVFRGRSIRPDFAAGCRFELQGHPDSDMNESYLITRVDHAFDTAQGCRNQFECVRDDASMGFRPSRQAARPTVSGPQTAIVTDTDDPDALCRVRVRFPWGDTPNECWVRVAQLLAGAGCGTWFVPSEGDEVVVDFLNGDFERPVITGRVYNGGDRLPIEDGPDVHTVRSKHGQQLQFNSENVIIENDGGSKIEMTNDGIITVFANGQSIELSSSGITITSSAAVNIDAASINLSAGMVKVDAGMSVFSGVVKCDVLISNSVVSSSYTPGAGNIW